jgi:hypothetical protein
MSVVFSTLRESSDKIDFALMATGGARMGTDARIAELSLRHQTLEETIEAEISRPAFDDIRIATLKKEKLRLKDEIEKLRAH